MKSAHCIVLIALVVKLGYGQILYDWGDGNGALYDWGDGNDHRREVNRQLVFSRPTVTGFDGFSNEALSSESLEVEPFSNGADYNRGSSSKERKKGRIKRRENKGRKTRREIKGRGIRRDPHKSLLKVLRNLRPLSPLRVLRNLSPLIPFIHGVIC